MSIRISISIHDVHSAGNNLRRAILDLAEISDWASGEIGDNFDNPGVGEFAARALADDFGADYYVDCEDGRAATLDEDGDVVWTEDSVVELLCPDVTEAIEYPEALRVMAEESAHDAETDCSAWRALAQSIRLAAEALENVAEA